MPAVFSVLLCTAAPPGQGAEAGGAFVKVDGRECLLRSVELFMNRENIKQIQVCFDPDMMDESRRKFGGHLGLTGVKVLGGGPRWIDQLAAAAPKLAAEVTHVIVHDAARPAVAYSDVDALMESAEKNAIATLTSPLRTPLLELDEGGNPVAFHTPAHFVQLLTPQVFSREKFMKIADSKQEPHASELTLVKGSPLNIRCGGPGDVGHVAAMLRMLPKPKVRPPTSPFEEAQW